jgi:hypothetical protein
MLRYELRDVEVRPVALIATAIVDNLVVASNTGLLGVSETS